MMFALCTAVTFFLPNFRAYSKANTAIRVLAFSVMIFSDSTTPGTTSCSSPEYKPSVFSRTMIKSTSSQSARRTIAIWRSGLDHQALGVFTHDDQVHFAKSRWYAWQIAHRPEVRIQIEHFPQPDVDALKPAPNRRFDGPFQRDAVSANRLDDLVR